MPSSSQLNYLWAEGAAASSGVRHAAHALGRRAMVPFPPAVWSGRTTAFVTAAILAPLVGTLLLAEGLRSVNGIATATQLVIYPAVLGAGVLLYVQHRLTGSNVVGWLTLCLTMYAVQGTMLAGLRAAQPEAFYSHPGWVVIIDAAAALATLTFVRMAEQVRLEVDPLTAGLAAGLVVAATILAADFWGPDLAMSELPVVGAQIALLLLGAAIAQAAFRLEAIPRWITGRLALGTIALVVNRVASCQDTERFVDDAAAIVTGVIGAVLMLSAAGSGLRLALQEHQDSLDSLADQVAAMEAHERDSLARLHEITNSIASIAVAASLIHHDGEVPLPRRRKLEQMLESEAGRLTRIMRDTDSAAWAPSDPSVDSSHHDSSGLIDLDEVIRPLVTSQEALQRRVTWQPTGHRAVGDVDAVAEVVNILLDNAARHAPHARPSIEVSRNQDTIEIAVCDDGPGVPAEVRQHLFEWGGRGPESNGHGIGLNVAYRLMTESGHSLRLKHDRTGTAFVLDLAAAPD